MWLLWKRCCVVRVLIGVERDILELLLGFSNGTRWGSWDFLLHADLVLSLGQPGEKTRHRLISKQELMLSRRIRSSGARVIRG